MTIIIINGTLILTQLIPLISYLVIAACGNDEKICLPATETMRLISLVVWGVLTTLNSGINALVYIIRIRRIRNVFSIMRSNATNNLDTNMMGIAVVVGTNHQ